MRWLVTIGLFSLTEAITVLLNVSNFAGIGSPAMLPSVRVLGFPVAPLLMLVVLVGLLSAILGRVPGIRFVSFHWRFNILFVLALCGAWPLGLLKG